MANRAPINADSNRAKQRVIEYFERELEREKGILHGMNACIG
jgi:hypothetical protein